MPVSVSKSLLEIHFLWGNRVASHTFFCSSVKFCDFFLSISLTGLSCFTDPSMVLGAISDYRVE